MLALVQRHRLVTLIGAGGCGKTRLAVETAVEAARPLADGARLVELAPIADGGRVEGALVDALGPAGGAGADVAERIGDRELLLLVDNCEHVIDDAARLIGALLRRCPRLRIIATSREPLRAEGEVTWWVPSLARDDQVALFRDRAAAAGAPLGDDARVAPICARLDGIPLAIELAAATVPTLTLDDIARLLDDRFALLVSGSRTALPRHQTLLAAVEWSERLLAEHERRALHRLSVFAGGFGFEAAASVCEVDAVTISALVTRSLVVADRTGDSSRFGLLETIREFGASRLRDAGEDAAVRHRHLAWSAALARQLEGRVTSADDLPALDAMEREQENLVAAVHWGIHGGGDRRRALGVAADLTLLWHLRGSHATGRGVLRAALDATGDLDGVERAKAHWGLGYLHAMLGDQEAACGELSQAAAHYRVLGDDVGLARTLNILGIVALFRGDTTTGREQLAEGVQLSRATGDSWSLIDCLGVLALVELLNGNVALARALAEEGLVLARRSSSRQGIRQNAQVLGQIAHYQGRLGEARTLLDESLAVLDAVGGEYSKAVSSAYLAVVCLGLGEIDRARSLVEDAEHLAKQSEIPFADLFASWARTQLARRADEPGALTSAVDHLVEVVHVGPPEADFLLAEIVESQLVLGRHDDAAQTATHLAQQRSPIGRVAEARVAIEHGQMARAERLLCEAASYAADQDVRLALPETLKLLHDLRGAGDERLLAAATALEAEGRGGPPVDIQTVVAEVLAGRKRVVRPATGWGSLTPAELDVVALVAEGLTNPQVAARLVISRATVKAHLAHVFSKLGVATRTELARFASGRGALPED